MSEIITAENLGKKYRICHRANGQGYAALRDVIAQKMKAPFGFLRKRKVSDSSCRSTTEEFWALKDVSFEIKHGQVVGIIGRNGAGKSTLLKILSRITEPTAGRAKLYGRVSSLLEVGTGFHPELTGRENIFLNGAVLGMTNAEIRGKFDEIVRFAGVEKFLDTPVKRYSSGMYVRLAFSVAAHLEPEILIVDEVLAVGDAEFQKRCLGKMKSVSMEKGRTVLFVSHNLQAVRALCSRGILLEAGQIKYQGSSDEAVRQYLESSSTSNRVEFTVEESRPAIRFVSIDKAELAKGNLVVDIGFKSPFSLNPPVAGLLVSSLLGTPVFGTNPRFHKNGYGQPKLSEGVLRMRAEKLPVHGGTYRLSVWLGDWQGDYDERRDVFTFEFKSGQPDTNTPSPESMGFVDIAGQWSVVW